jgi:hypothetical protein
VLHTKLTIISSRLWIELVQDTFLKIQILSLALPFEFSREFQKNQLLERRNYWHNNTKVEEYRSSS